MKYAIILFFISLNTFYFGQLHTVQDATIFSESFSNAVLMHNEDEILKHIDVDYKKGQLGKLLKGNKEQFINEMLSGFGDQSEEYMNIDYKTITEMTVTSIGNEESSTDNWKVNFQLKIPKNTINISILLIAKKSARKSKLGFIGGIG